MDRTQIIASPGVPQIVITREFKAPGELLFRTHSDACHGVPSPDAIVQTYEAEAMRGHVSLCTTTFEARAGGTLLRQKTVFKSVEDRDGYVAAGMEEGVVESMKRLTELVAVLTREG